MVRCCSSYTWTAYVWAGLSIIAAILCPFGLYFSNWLERKTDLGTYNSVSSFRVCLNESSRISVDCSSYLMFGEMYSATWKAVTLLMGLGACLLVLVALTSLFGCCVRKLFNTVVMAITTSFQILGAVLFVVSLVIFPAGMDEPPVRELCGAAAGKYNKADCDIGWAFIVIIVGTVFALIAGVFFSWTTRRWRDKEDDESYSI